MSSIDVSIKPEDPPGGIEPMEEQVHSRQTSDENEGAANTEPNWNTQDPMDPMTLFQYKVEDPDEPTENNDTETVEELLARAERLVMENRALIENSTRHNDLFGSLDDLDMIENPDPYISIVQSALEDADRAILMAQQVQGQAQQAEPVDLTLNQLLVTHSADNSILEIIEIQQATPHEISDNDDDDDDVIFVAQVDPPRAQPVVVDLSVDSPVPDVRPASPFDEIQNQVVDFVLDHTETPSTSNGNASRRQFEPIVQVMAIEFEVGAMAEAALAASAAKNNAAAAVAAARTDTIDDSSPPKRPRTESANNKQINCAVCLEPPFDNRPAATTCGHVFCYNCIQQAIKMCKRCPMCQKKITAKQVHMLYI